MIQLKAKSGGIDLAQKLAKGDDGGYYIPIVDENGNLNWLPSEEEMPLVDASNIRGPRGDSGIYIGSEPPEDEDITVWVNPEGEMSAELATKEYVDNAITAIELTPGPAGKDGEPGAPGKDGEDGKDYVLTEADKEEIASMVEVSGGGDVDLSDYYTKEEIDGLLSNLPVGDIPSGEEVKW